MVVVNKDAGVVCTCTHDASRRILGLPPPLGVRCSTGVAKMSSRNRGGLNGYRPTIYGPGFSLPGPCISVSGATCRGEASETTP